MLGRRKLNKGPGEDNRGLIFTREVRRAGRGGPPPPVGCCQGKALQEEGIADAKGLMWERGLVPEP